MAKVFKKLAEFKPNDNAVQDKGPIVVGHVAVVGNMLQFSLPLQVTEDMCRIFDEDVERNGKTEVVSKGNMVVSFEIPENLELTVDGLTFRVKRGGMAAKRYITLGFNPAMGYKRIPLEDDAAEIIEAGIGE